MKIELNTELVCQAAEVSNTQVAVVKAQKLAWDTKCAADKALAAHMPTIWFGRDALVEHVHADANHGNPSDKVVVSRVVNVFFDDLGRVALRIQLGSTKGVLGTQYASILVDKVTALVGQSEKAFA